MKIKISSIDKFKQKYDKIFDIAQTNHLDGKNEYHYNDEFGKCRTEYISHTPSRTR